MFAVYAILAAAAAIMLNIFLRIDNWQRDWTTNFAKLEPDASDPLLRPLTLPMPQEDAARRIIDWANSQDHWKVQSTEANDRGTAIHLTRTTGWMRYTDDIRLQLIDDETETRLEAESQSRLGKGDLGQNPRNLKELVQGLK